MPVELHRFIVGRFQRQIAALIVPFQKTPAFQELRHPLADPMRQQLKVTEGLLLKSMKCSCAAELSFKVVAIHFFLNAKGVTIISYFSLIVVLMLKAALTSAEKLLCEGSERAAENDAEHLVILEHHYKAANNVAVTFRYPTWKVSDFG